MKNRKLNNLTNVFKNLFEQKEPSEDLFSDEEPEEDTEESEPEEDTESEPEEDTESEPEEDTESEPEEPEEEISKDDEVRLKDSIDAEIESVLGDFESDARKSAEINLKKNEQYNESSFKKLYRKKLWESTASDIDIHSFASNVARLVKNYSNLLDIETIILNKAYSYIDGLYGENTVKELKDVLEQEYDLEIARNSVENDLPEAPVAVGAVNTSGGM